MKKTQALTHLTVRQNCDWAPLLHQNPRSFATEQILWVFLAFPFSFSSLLPSLLNSQHRLDYQQQWPKRHWEECLKNVKEYIAQTQRLFVYGLVTTGIELASLVYKSLNCSGFVVLFFLNRETSRCCCTKIISGSQQNMILQIRQKNRKEKMKVTCMAFLYTITLRNKTVGHTFLHRSTMEIAISVKKDGNVTSQDVTLLLSVGLVMLENESTLCRTLIQSPVQKSPILQFDTKSPQSHA